MPNFGRSVWMTVLCSPNFLRLFIEVIKFTGSRFLSSFELFGAFSLSLLTRKVQEHTQYVSSIAVFICGKKGLFLELHTVAALLCIC